MLNELFYKMFCFVYRSELSFTNNVLSLRAGDLSFLALALLSPSHYQRGNMTYSYHGAMGTDQLPKSNVTLSPISMNGAQSETLSKPLFLIHLLAS